MNVSYVDHMGTDDSIVNAARVSFAKTADNYSKEQNDKLNKYLADHGREMPFAHTAITLRVSAPISIRTQCFKHKVGFVENEESRRYLATEPTYYIPKFREAPNMDLKQGSGGYIEDQLALAALDTYEAICAKAIESYKELLDLGVAPEQARFVLPQGMMTCWIWTGSLLAYARFYKLRTDPHAQKEIQLLALAVGDILSKLFPVSWDCLTTR